jgi:transcriptional regulator with XRE-family HTH domain
MQRKSRKQAGELLDGLRRAGIMRCMTDGSTRSGRKRARFVGRPNDLGGLLADLRAAKGLSLRQVEEATDNAVSNAYLSQLEKGKIQKPSPNVLHSLAEVYAVPYETLMERAGYLLPSESRGGQRRRRLAAFAIDDLTAEEEEELLKYLAFLRSRNPSS